MSRTKLLVVDDSEISRKPFRSLAGDGKPNPCTVLEAETGEEGLEIFKVHDAIEYALVDVHLPGISGFKMLEAMRTHDPVKFESIQVFMMCSNGPDHGHGHEHDHEHEDACDSLYVSWLLKPIDITLFERFVFSDSRMRSAISNEEGTNMHQDSLRVLFEESDHLTEKQIQALEQLVKSLTQNHD
tara:strand:- start:90 stop:644 length:555 start_codon:yes stop_codon:yes gene_type:complete